MGTLVKRTAIVKRTAKAASLPAITTVVAVILGWAWPIALLSIGLTIPLGWMLSKSSDE